MRRPHASDDAALTLGTVDVAASASQSGPLSARSILTSVDILGKDMIESQQVDNTWELLRRAPGVMLTEMKQGNVSGKFSFRGFNGEGEINAVKLLIDGIPSNANDGSMQFFDMVSPLDIQRIEIVRGTNDPRYGLNNIAGNVNVVTRASGDYTDARVSYGSYDTLEVQLSKGIESGNWTQNYMFGYRSSDGYRDHAASERSTFAGKWFYTADDGSYRFGVIARHYSNHAEESGYLTYDQSRSTPRMTLPYVSTDGGKRELNQLSAHLDADITDKLSWSAKAYMNVLKDYRWVRYSEAASQQSRFTDETQYGAITTLTYRPITSWAKQFALEGGFDMQRQDNVSQRARTLERVPQAQTRDQNFTFDTYGAYLQAVIEPINYLKIVPAFRVDSIHGSFTDRLTGITSPINDYGLIKQPKFSVVYSPWQQASLYGNWGRSFQVGAGSAAYRTSTQSADLKPSINDGWETGIKFTPASWLDGRVAYWQQVASDEVRRKLGDANGDSENIGKTRRRGFDLQLNMRPEKRVNLWAAYSRQYSKIVVPSPHEPLSQGKEIDHVPHHLISGGVDFQVAPALRLSAWVNGQGNYFLERTNTTGKFGGYFLMNVGVFYQVNSEVGIDLQIKNLANRYTEYVWYDAGRSYHGPGDGRAVYSSVSMKF